MSEEVTVEVCQVCGSEFDDLLDAVVNAEHSGPFRQETRVMDSEVADSGAV